MDFSWCVYRTYPVVWAAIAVHSLIAVILICTKHANGATDVTAILEWINVEYLPALLFASSGLAVIGLLDLGFIWYIRLSLLLPQQAFITLSVSGVVTAIIHGAYGDGTPKPGVHIFVDQIWLVAFFFVHAYAVARRASC